MNQKIINLKNKYLAILLCLLLSVTLTGCFNHYDLAEVDSVTDLDSALMGTVKIQSIHSDNILGSGLESTSTGTGIVFSEDNEYYYALTNNHVIYTGAWSYTITITNYKGESVNGRVLKKSAAYDCAIVTFKKEITCNVLPLATVNPEVGVDTISIDNNFNHYEGQVLEYVDAPTLSYGKSASRVKFEVFTSSSYTHKGSSGGPILDNQYNVIGMMYAGHAENDYSFDYCLVIPVEKLLKFIK